MSRSGYSDDCDDNWALIRWRGAVTSAIRGRPGQAFLRELLAALEAMPVRELIGQSFSNAAGMCTLGVVGAARGIKFPEISDNYDSNDYEGDDSIRRIASHALKIPSALAAEIMYYNDEGGDYCSPESPAQRWTRMHKWVSKRIKEPT